MSDDARMHSQAQVEVLEVRGNPGQTEQRAARQAIERLVANETKAGLTSLWPLGARPTSDVGFVDYRDDVGRDDLWRLSALNQEGWSRP